MNKILVVANWKMNPGSLKEAKQLLAGVKKYKKTKTLEVVICPPFVYLPLVKSIGLGAQNVSEEEKGAFTGEVSASMLKDAKVEYVIVGHSERRRYFAETDEVVNKKIKKVVDVNLTPIVCIGETKEQKDLNQMSEVLERQISGALKNVSREQIKNLVIAYEPVWAIGTGNNCLPEQTQSALLCIKKIIANLYNRQIADATRILYGGSVSGKNASQYIGVAGANGLLVGGASLNVEEFLQIIESIE